jgi:SSS family solute:Na+ symporter
MDFSALDIAGFAGFLILVVAVSLYASRKEQTGEDYFLAGRGLSWWLIGVSLIAANISSEHFVGMAGEGFRIGLAIACFECIGAVALVFVALFLLPKFLRSGIYTLPEFLEYRYSATPRAIMAFLLMLAYVAVGLAGVLYSGALALQSVFGVDLTAAAWGIGLCAGLYTIYGGLKAVVWSELLQGTALMGGGALVLVVSLDGAGGLGAFLTANADRLHVMLPADHPDLPWTIYLLGIWVPNIAYFGLNQFITQRALAARSLRDGQLGVLFAAFLKLLMPFLIVFPGIAAYGMFEGQGIEPDRAFPTLMTQVLPAGFRGVMFAALFGAVMSSLDSMLNSASTIFTIDLYQRHWARGKASSASLIRVGRWSTAGFLLMACLLAPALAGMGGIYQYMQLVWNLIWPGILAAFLVGLWNPRTPPLAATLALVLCPLSYIGFNLALKAIWNSSAYLNAAAGAFLFGCALMLVITRLAPLAEPRRLPEAGVVELIPHPAAKPLGAAVVALTVGLYVYFW